MALEPSGNISKGACGQIADAQEDATLYQRLTGRGHPLNNRARDDPYQQIRWARFATDVHLHAFACRRQPRRSPAPTR
jgi:hypothetical protein